MRIRIRRELKNMLLLAIIFNSMMLAGVSSMVQVVYAKDETFDLTDYDAESNILGFIPYADSGLDTVFVNKYPMKELIANYEGSQDIYDAKTRVLFKIGEWYLNDELTDKEEYTYQDTKLIKTTYYLETDLIAWTDLDYDDVFTDGTSNWEYELQDDFQWLEINKRLNFGWSPVDLNVMDIRGARISIWDDDLRDIVEKEGNDEIQGWTGGLLGDYPKKYYERYPYLEGLQELASEKSNWKEDNYEKYLEWNYLHLPGGFDGNVRNWANDRWKDFSIVGDVFFEVNLKESFWSQIEFPEEVEGEDGDFTLDRVALSIDDCFTLSPEEEGSRTSLDDLQDLYDENEQYSEHTAEGNYLATDPETEGHEIEGTNILDLLHDYVDKEEALDEIPEDHVGDGYDISGVIKEAAKWDWEEQQYTMTAQAELPGTATLTPHIWEGEEPPSEVTESDLRSLKPLDKMEASQEFMGMNIKDRDYAVFKAKIEFGPELIVDFAQLDIRRVQINMKADLWGNAVVDHSITDKKLLDHVPFGANVHNQGLRQTLRLKFIALSSYDYVPHQAEMGGEVAPGFPLDDTEKEWPDSVDTAGDLAFTAWTETENPFDAFLGFLMALGEMLFGDFWWIIIIVIIALLAIGIWLIIKVIRGFFPKGGVKKTTKKLDALMDQQFELERMKSLNERQKKSTIAHIEGIKAMTYSRIILGVNITVSVIFMLTGLYVLTNIGIVRGIWT